MCRVAWAGVGLRLALTFAGALGVGQLIAQATSKPVARDPREVRSPMVLSTVFLPADRSLWKTEWITGQAYVDLGAFHCENVSISALRMRPKRAASDRVLVEIETSLSNRRGHDKEVAVRYDILNGEEEVAHVGFGPLQVDETDTKTRSVSVEVPESALKTDPMTALRITVTVRNI